MVTILPLCVGTWSARRVNCVDLYVYLFRSWTCEEQQVASEDTCNQRRNTSACCTRQPAAAAAAAAAAPAPAAAAAAAAAEAEGDLVTAPSGSTSNQPELVNVGASPERVNDQQGTVRPCSSPCSSEEQSPGPDRHKSRLDVTEQRLSRRRSLHAAMDLHAEHGAARSDPAGNLADNQQPRKKNRLLQQKLLELCLCQVSIHYACEL